MPSAANEHVPIAPASGHALGYVAPFAAQLWLAMAAIPSSRSVNVRQISRLSILSRQLKVPPTGGGTFSQPETVVQPQAPSSAMWAAQAREHRPGSASAPLQH